MDMKRERPNIVIEKKMNKRRENEKRKRTNYAIYNLFAYGTDVKRSTGT